MNAERGRPKGVRERVKITLPLFDEERDFFDQAANTVGLSRAEWMRQQLTTAAEEALGRPYSGPKDVYDDDHE